MSKYIKLEDAIRVIDDSFDSIPMEQTIEILQARRKIRNLPTIDIVHCGECKCCRDELIEEYMPLYIYCEKWNHETDFDGFCSAGERYEE